MQFAVFLTFSLSVLAQNVPVDSAVVSGEVTTDSGQRLPGAKVSISLDPWVQIAQGLPLFSGKSGVTDSGGKFKFDNISPGTYRLNVELPGYSKQSYGGKPGSLSGTPLIIHKNDKISNLVVRMTRQSAISGRVTTAEGDLAQGVSVYAVRWTYADGTRRLQEQGQQGITGNQGEFRITGLAPGQYFVYAVPKTANQRLDKIERTVLPTYAPNELEASRALPIELSAGVDGFADIRLRQDKQVTVRGTVVGQSGDSPPAGAVVLLMQDSSTPVVGKNVPPTPGVFTLPYVAIARTDAQGHFDLSGVLPGLHRLLAFGGNRIDLNFGNAIATMRAKDGPTPDDASSGSVEISVPDDGLDDVTIHLSPGGKITSKIDLDGMTFDDRQRALWARSATAPSQEYMAVALGAIPGVTLTTEEGVSFGGRFPTRTDRPGATQLRSVGRYFVKVDGVPSQYYVKSIYLGGVDFTRKRVEFTGGTADLEILLGIDGGQVTGSVADREGNPTPGAPVSLWPVTPDLSQPTGGALVSTAGQDGSFTFFNVAPGEYLVAAFEDLPDIGLGQYPPFLAYFTGNVEHVRVKAEGIESTTIKPIPKRDSDKIVVTLR